MKKSKFLTSILLLVVIAFFNLNIANALCINCGCNKAYDKCINNNGDGACQDCGEEYCKENKRACHGTGIKIKIFK